MSIVPVNVKRSKSESLIFLSGKNQFLADFDEAGVNDLVLVGIKNIYPLVAVAVGADSDGPEMVAFADGISGGS